jgi:hypothetical protein
MSVFCLIETKFIGQRADAWSHSIMRKQMKRQSKHMKDYEKTEAAKVSH